MEARIVLQFAPHDEEGRPPPRDELFRQAEALMEELLAVEEPPAIADIATAGDADRGIIEVEAVLTFDRESVAVDLLLSALSSAASAVTRATGDTRQHFFYRKQEMRIEYL